MALMPFRFCLNGLCFRHSHGMDCRVKPCNDWDWEVVSLLV